MINITKYLRYCPKGAKLYSPVIGNCELDYITDRIMVKSGEEKYIFNFYGQLFYDRHGLTEECLLFPSRENRDWATFITTSKPHKHFETFQKVLVNNGNFWRLKIYGFYNQNDFTDFKHTTIDDCCYNDEQIIPYEGNEDKLGMEFT